jgi:glycosyltransferase involved in cell wall biosynthesis
MLYLNMIVRDEASCIKRCLDSIKPYIQGWAILDTGSTDGTQDIIRKELANLPGELREADFTDFATARNKALVLARAWTTEEDYLLLMDADEELKQEENTIFPTLSADVYDSLIRLGGCEYWRTLIIKAHWPWKWAGPCHERIACDGPFTRDKIRGFWRQAYQHKEEDKKERSLWYAAMLEKEMDKDPKDARACFYWAQSLRDAGELEKAALGYRRRATMGGFQEEVYISLLNVARIYERLNKPEDVVINAYLMAAASRPSRAEALGSLMYYLRSRKRFYEAALIAREACTLMPTNDLLFVEPEWVNWRILDEASISYTWAGRLRQARNAILALITRPIPEAHKQRIEANRDLIIKAATPPNKPQS